VNAPRSAPATITATDSAAVAPTSAPTSALYYALLNVSRTLRREPAVAIALGYRSVALAGISFNFNG